MWNQFTQRGLAPRQAWEPIRSNFQTMVPIYQKSQRPQNHHKPRDQYIQKNNRKMNILGSNFEQK